MKRNLVSILLIIAVIAGMLGGCSAPAETAIAPEKSTTREFTDDCGRTLIIPSEIHSIAVSGPLAQTYLYPLCPELFAGISTAFAKDVEKYISAEFLALPEIGQLYGGKGTMDLEALLSASPDIIIDVGDAKDGMADDLDKLTEQTGIPFIHINASVLTAPSAYRKLGELTGKTEQAEALAVWCENSSALVLDMMEKVDADNARRNILYCLGEAGLNVMAEGSFHAETVNLMGNNLAKLSDVVAHGNGNEVDMEQIIEWAPEVILFEKEAAYSMVADDVVWQQLSAIENGEYYAVPYGPYGWLSSPPAVQRYLGMLWLGAILYPDYCSYDLKDKVYEYYDLFYHYNLSDADYTTLTEYSLG